MTSVPVKIRGVYRGTKAFHEVNNMEDVYKLCEGF